jgi:predicted rRNA methylase YqxC with S4 and FtsJ domains
MKNIINFIVSLITGKISFSFLKEVLPLFNSSLQSLVAKLLPQAIEIVTELAKNGKLTDRQKQKEAFLQIQKIAKKEGLEAGSSLINLVIELAVSSLKK